MNFTLWAYAIWGGMWHTRFFLMKTSTFLPFHFGSKMFLNKYWRIFFFTDEMQKWKTLISYTIFLAFSYSKIT